MTERWRGIYRELKKEAKSKSISIGMLTSEGRDNRGAVKRLAQKVSQPPRQISPEEQGFCCCT